MRSSALLQYCSRASTRLLGLSGLAVAEATGGSFSSVRRDKHDSAEDATIGNAESRAPDGVPVIMSAAVLIDRLPVVVPKPPEWVLQYEQFRMDRSVLHKKSYPAAFLAAAAEPPSDDTRRQLAPGEVDIQTTTDLFAFFDDPSRRTAADEANDTRSLQRALDRRLYLLVRGRALGKAPSGAPDSVAQDWSSERWRLPEVAYAQEDTLRQCAEGAVAYTLSVDPEDVYFVGNAPFAHLEDGSEGGAEADVSSPYKRFFFWAHWFAKTTDFQRGSETDYAWFTKEEVLSHMEGTQEAKMLEDVLLD